MYGVAQTRTRLLGRRTLNPQAAKQVLSECAIPTSRQNLVQIGYINPSWLEMVAHAYTVKKAREFCEIDVDLSLDVDVDTGTVRKEGEVRLYKKLPLLALHSRKVQVDILPTVTKKDSNLGYSTPTPVEERFCI